MDADGMDAAFFRGWLERAARVVEENADWLTELDSAIGDADHGANLRRGFAAVTEALADQEPDTPKAVLALAGKTLVSKVGGASGPLYGTALRAMGRSFKDASAVDAAALGEALEAAVAAVEKLGEGRPGDKTMLDALGPAADALRSTGSLTAAATAAEEGAEATVPMLARRGRAAYLGERSVGHRDPGASSAALLVRVLADRTAA